MCSNNKMKINLHAVVECIEFEGELLTHYYNKKTDIINFEYKIIIALSRARSHVKCYG